MSGGGGGTYTLGLLTDLTGPAAASEGNVKLGVEAGVGLANTDGYHLSYVVADAQSSPSGALAAAQKLVEQDHVFAVIAISGLTFAAAGYLTSHGIPVLGAATDGLEWATSRNMFSVIGTADYSKPVTTYAQFLKDEGVQNIGAVGYGIVPSSADFAKGLAAGATNSGIKLGYLNAQFPFGSTNVGPVAIAMKSAGVDGLASAVEQNSSFALIEALHQEGVELKGAVLPVGYGADLFQAGPGAENAAQNVSFTILYEPVEMHTAATEAFQKALAKYAQASGEPSYEEYMGYVSVDAFRTGIKAAGANPTQASFINAMLNIRNYPAAGLLDGHDIGFAMDQRGFELNDQTNCAFFTLFSGQAFHTIQGADPLCGRNLAGSV